MLPEVFVWLLLVALTGVAGDIDRLGRHPVQTRIVHSAEMSYTLLATKKLLLVVFTRQQNYSTPRSGILNDTGMRHAVARTLQPSQVLALEKLLLVTSTVPHAAAPPPRPPLASLPPVNEVVTPPQRAPGSAGVQDPRHPGGWQPRAQPWGRRRRRRARQWRSGRARRAGVGVRVRVRVWDCWRGACSEPAGGGPWL